MAGITAPDRAPPGAGGQQVEPAVGREVLPDLPGVPVHERGAVPEHLVLLLEDLGLDLVERVVLVHHGHGLHVDRAVGPRVVVGDALHVDVVVVPHRDHVPVVALGDELLHEHGLGLEPLQDAFELFQDRRPERAVTVPEVAQQGVRIVRDLPGGQEQGIDLGRDMVQGVYRGRRLGQQAAPGLEVFPQPRHGGQRVRHLDEVLPLQHRPFPDGEQGADVGNGRDRRGPGGVREGHHLAQQGEPVSALDPGRARGEVGERAQSDIRRDERLHVLLQGGIL
jgi:hypothetical protein